MCWYCEEHRLAIGARCPLCGQKQTDDWETAWVADRRAYVAALRRDFKVVASDRKEHE